MIILQLKVKRKRSVNVTIISNQTIYDCYFKRVPTFVSSKEVLNYSDKIHPVVSMMTSSPSLKPVHLYVHLLTQSYTQYIQCHKEEDHLSQWFSP